jgi:hypothetical protein
VIGVAGSSYWCYRLVTDPLPPGVDDSSSPLGNLVARAFLVVFVVGGGCAGAGFGALVGYVVRLGFSPTIRVR